MISIRVLFNLHEFVQNSHAQIPCGEIAIALLVEVNYQLNISAGESGYPGIIQMLVAKFDARLAPLILISLMFGINIRLQFRSQRKLGFSAYQRAR